MWKEGAEISAPKQPLKYPFGLMRVGETFFIPATHRNTARNVSAAASKAKREFSGHRYTTHSVIEDGRPGVRVWRIE